MKIFEGLRGWLSQSGAPWRPYLDASCPAEPVFAVAGGRSAAISRRTGGSRKSLIHQVAANDGALGASDRRDVARSPHALIVASRVTGARVVCGNDRVDCRIHDISIVAFSDFLGLCEKIYPLPWRFLTFDTAQNAYKIPFDGAAIRAAPSLTVEDLEWFGAGEADWHARMAQYYWPYPMPLI